MASLTIRPVSRLSGTIRPPSDKSLTHRALMFAAIASGESLVEEPLLGEDCEATLDCLVQLGLSAQRQGRHLRLSPAPEWRAPSENLYCGNSGTTIRLLAGLIASRPIDATLTGDASLSLRPMKRIADPLRLMGASVVGETPPLQVRGAALQGIDYLSPVASAQVKSAVLLAGLRADGTTAVTEPSPSRDHTERLLSALGVPLTRVGTRVTLSGGRRFEGFKFEVPADISSAAFFLVAGSLISGSEIVIEGVGINPTRTGILDVLEQIGAAVEVSAGEDRLGEPVGTIKVKGQADLGPFEIGGDLVPRLIDEIPVLAVLATQCNGVSFIRDAGELRVKESDRIDTVARGLQAMGATVDTFQDGMAITGPIKLKGAKIEAKMDHRIGMAFAIAGLVADGPTEIFGAEAISTSYPGFAEDLARLSV